jgi:predicted nuclease with RNAse H fold
MLTTDCPSCRTNLDAYDRLAAERDRTERSLRVLRAAVRAEPFNAIRLAELVERAMDADRLLSIAGAVEVVRSSHPAVFMPGLSPMVRKADALLAAKTELALKRTDADAAVDALCHEQGRLTAALHAEVPLVSLGQGTYTRDFGGGK